jgi:hypothetical protein
MDNYFANKEPFESRFEPTHEITSILITQQFGDTDFFKPLNRWVSRNHFSEEIEIPENTL